MASITDYARMCTAQVCSKCGLDFHNNGYYMPCTIFVAKHPAEASAIIDKWCAEHPQKTYWQDFLEKFPKTNLTEKSVISTLCRAKVYGQGEYCINRSANCDACWNEIMPEETGK